MTGTAVVVWCPPGVLPIVHRTRPRTAAEALVRIYQIERRFLESLPIADHIIGRRFIFERST